MFEDVRIKNETETIQRSFSKNAVAAPRGRDREMRPLPAQCPPTLCPHRVHQGAATALGISTSLPADLGESSKSAQTAQSLGRVGAGKESWEGLRCEIVLVFCPEGYRTGHRDDLASQSFPSSCQKKIAAQSGVASMADRPRWCPSTLAAVAHASAVAQSAAITVTAERPATPRPVRGSTMWL